MVLDPNLLRGIRVRRYTENQSENILVILSGQLSHWVLTLITSNQDYFDRVTINRGHKTPT